MWDALFPYVAALLPTVAVGVLFYLVVKSILEGDRRERLAQSKWAAKDAEKEREEQREKDREEQREKDRQEQPGRDTTNIAPHSQDGPS